MPRTQKISDFVRKNGSAVVILLLVLFASVFVNHFFSLNNFALILKQSAIPIIACIGMTVVLMTGGIDLSLGYMIGLSSISVGLLVKTYGFGVPLSILITLALGALVGAFQTGFCVQRIKVPAFITTLGTGFILLGVAQIISNGASINHLPTEFFGPRQNQNRTPEHHGVHFAGILRGVLLHPAPFHLWAHAVGLRAFGACQPPERLPDCPHQHDGVRGLQHAG